jgi:hypothetical protein
MNIGESLYHSQFRPRVSELLFVFYPFNITSEAPMYKLLYIPLILEEERIRNYMSADKL